VKVLVKLGGTLLDEDGSRRRIASELAGLRAQGIRLAVVHGGGKQMTRFLAERGVKSQFVRGLRVTTPEVIDAVLKVFAGSVNHQLVASFIAAGAAAVGLSGIDACLTEAELLDPELGMVGRPVRGDARLLDILVEAGYLPVIACVAGDRSGNVYNVNADQMAVACATSFQAGHLCFLTDVDGVKDGEGHLLPHLTASEAKKLISDKIATGGMEAKLNAACEALAGGVGSVRIASGALPNAVTRLVGNEELGTRLVAG